MNRNMVLRTDLKISKHTLPPHHQGRIGSDPPHVFRPQHRGPHTRAWKQGYHPILLEIPIVPGPQNLFIDLRISPQIPFTILLPILSQTMPQRSPPQKRPLNTTYNGVYIDTFLACCKQSITGSKMPELNDGQNAKPTFSVLM